MEFSADFLHNIHIAFGETGRQWLSDLPALLEYAAQRWDLQIGAPMLLSYNYVTAARRADGLPVVLKIGFPNPEFLSELAALRYMNGDGCVRLLDADEQKYMFILERLMPGEMLASLTDDDQRTRIAGELMARIHRPAPKEMPFIKLSDWFAELGKLRPRFAGATGPFPEKLCSRVENLLPVLFQTGELSLIHGDCHHFNILSSGTGWCVIDPKGVIGPPGYECGPLLTNPIPDFPYLPGSLRQVERRIAILSECLDLSRENIRDWGLCHCLLSGWWDMAENGSGTEYSMACADLIARAAI